MAGPKLFSRRSQSGRSRYGAMGFPTLVVIGPDGRLLSRHMGLVEIDEIEASLQQLRASI